MYNAGSDFPEVLTLVRDAKEFVSSNRGWVFEYLKPLLPYLLICGFTSAVAPVYSPLFQAANVGVVCLMACFALSWHKAVLSGLSLDHKVNLYSWGKTKDKEFFSAFFLVAITPLLFGALGGVFLGAAMYYKTPWIVIFGVSLFFGFVFWGILKSLSLSFMLPARAVGVKISGKAAEKISKGLIGKFFWACFCLSLGPILFFFLFVIAVIVVVGLVLGMKDNPHVDVLLPLLLVLPALYLKVILVARYVTVLSFLYQWSVQNRFKSQNPANEVLSQP